MSITFSSFSRLNVHLLLIGVAGIGGLQVIEGGDLPLGKGLPVIAASKVETRFSELSPEKTGVDFSNIWKAPQEMERALSLSFGAGGVAIGDYDADGLPDLYLTRPFDGGRLYRNLGGFKFKDVTESCGLGGDEFWQASPSFADLDGDGDLDLYV